MITNKKNWRNYIISIIAIFLLLGAIGGCASGKDSSSSSSPEAASDVASSSEQSEASASSELQEETKEVIYEGDEKINNFILAFNEAYPESAITTDDIWLAAIKGKTTPSRIGAKLDGLSVEITAAKGDKRPLNISVFFTTYQNRHTDEYANCNQHLFEILMHVARPDLSNEEIVARWQEVLDDSTHTPEWDDGCRVENAGPQSTDEAGSFDYIKISI